MNYRDYMISIQEKLGETKAPDGIKELPWFDVVIRELNEISKKCATELQTGLGVWEKPSGSQALHEAPPTRLLALEIALASWLGWIMHEKHGEDENKPLSTKDCWKRIEDAYLYGVELSKKGETP